MITKNNINDDINPKIIDSMKQFAESYAKSTNTYFCSLVSSNFDSFSAVKINEIYFCMLMSCITNQTNIDNEAYKRKHPVMVILEVQSVSNFFI